MIEIWEVIGQGRYLRKLDKNREYPNEYLCLFLVSSVCFLCRLVLMCSVCECIYVYEHMCVHVHMQVCKWVVCEGIYECACVYTLNRHIFIINSQFHRLFSLFLTLVFDFITVLMLQSSFLFSVTKFQILNRTPLSTHFLMVPTIPFTVFPLILLVQQQISQF